LTHDGTSKQRSIGGNRAGTPPLTHRAAVAAVARFAAVLLLVGVVAVGVHRPQVWTGTSGGDLWRGEQANLGGGAAVWPLIVAGALLLVMLLLLGRSRRRRRRPEDELVHSESPIPWTAKALAMTVVLAVIATLVVVLWYLLRSSQWPNSTGDAGAAELGIPPAQSPAVDQPAPPAGRLWWPIVAAGVAAVVLLLIAGRAMVAARRSRPATAPAAATPPATNALAAGTAALREPADDRDAVIACYAAMERELGERGVLRSPAQTPTELLAQATGARLIRSPAARELIDLFHHARHSSRPMGPVQRRSAERALCTLSDDLMSAR
jgi:uncharacterized membrane protein